MLNIKLSIQDQDNLRDLILANKDYVISNWLKSDEVLQIVNKYSISEEEVEYYFNYLWTKLVRIISENIQEQLNIKKINNYKIISTNFFDFIQTKKISLEDLREILFYFKNQYFHFLELERGKLYFYTDYLFDLFFQVFSNNFNEWFSWILSQYEDIFDSLNIISKINIHWKITYVNDEFCRLTWYSREEVLWIDFSKFFNVNTLETNKTRSWIIKNVNKNNSTYWLKTTITPLLDSEDNIIEYLFIWDDITEIKELNKNLEEYISALNESAMVIKLDDNFIINDINNQFLSVSGYQKNEIIWKCYININSENNINSICDSTSINNEMTLEIKNQLNNKKSWNWVIKNFNVTWEVFWTSTNIIPILNIDNEITEYVCILSDITNLKNAQINLYDSYNKLKELDIKKDEFLSISSHELRTPMTAIKWYLSMIIDWDYWKIPDKVKEVLNLSYDNILRLITIVNDMFDLSKLEAWKMNFNISEFDIFDYLSRLSSDMDMVWKSRWIKFISNISWELKNTKIKTDKDKLNQVIINLITNAFKFTIQNWFVALNARLNWEAKVLIEIEDNWVWIPETELENIFSKFYQVDSYTKRKEEWLWLWLALSQNIMKNLWYEIKVLSQVWVWSKFYFEIDTIR